VGLTKPTAAAQEHTQAGAPDSPSLPFPGEETGADGDGDEDRVGRADMDSLLSPLRNGPFPVRMNIQSP